MALNDSDQKILEEVVTLEGDCLKKERCEKCPFRSMCLPEFLNIEPPTKNQRKEMAAKILMHNAVMEDEQMDKKSIEEQYTWPTQEQKKS
jgi:hypothetical protein